MLGLVDIFYKNKYPFESFSSEHFCILLLFAFIIYIEIKNFKIIEKIDKFNLILFFIIVVQQLMLYSWYLVNETANVKDMLPLYQCRILTILCAISLLCQKEKLIEITYLLSVPAAVVALTFPDVEGYGFPNFMFLQFFLGHFMMIFSTVYLKLKNKIKINKNTLKESLKIVCYYFVIMLIVDTIFNLNYGYLLTPPESIGAIVKDFTPFEYFFLEFFSNIAMVLFFYKINCILQKAYSKYLDLKEKIKN